MKQGRKKELLRDDTDALNNACYTNTPQRSLLTSGLQFLNEVQLKRLKYSTEALSYHTFVHFIFSVFS